MIYSPSTLANGLGILRSLDMDALEGQLAHHEEDLSKTSEARDRAIIRENICLVKKIIAEKADGRTGV